MMNVLSITRASLLVIISATACYANPINVRSGEHETFERLVMQISSEFEWSLQEAEGSIKISINDFQRGFNTSEIFKFISGDYIDRINSGQDTFEVFYSCECETIVFDAGGGYVAIDIGRQIVSNPFAYSSDASLKTSDGIGTSVPLHEEFISRSEIGVPSIEGFLLTTPHEENWPPANPILYSELGLESLGLEIRAPSLAANRVVPEQEIGRSIESAEKRSVVKDDLSARNINESLFLLQENISVRENGLVSENFDEDNLSRGYSEVDCGTHEDFSINLWDPKKREITSLSEARKGLFNSRDSINVQNAIILAQSLTFEGLTAEARNILSVAPEKIDADGLISEISRVIDGETESGLTVIESLKGCSDELQLWAFVGAGKQEENLEINVSAILRALSTLPIHLRMLVSGRVSEKLLALGYENQANASLRTVERSSVPLAPDSELSKVEIQLADGKNNQAGRVLLDAVVSNREHSALALLRLVDLSFANNEKLDDSVMELLEAYALQMRGSATGHKLRASHMVALARSGKFFEAFQQLNSLDRDEYGEHYEEAFSKILEVIVADASNGEFLMLLNDFNQDDYAPVTPEIAARISNRFMEIGLPQRAIEALPLLSSISENPELSLLYAKILARSGNILDALSALEQIPSNISNPVKAELLLEEEEFQRAAELFAEMGLFDQAGIAALLGDNRDFLATVGGDPFSPLIDLYNANFLEPSVFAEDGMLTTMEKALNESVEARGIIENIINE